MSNSTKGDLSHKEEPGTEPESGHMLWDIFTAQKEMFYENISVILLKDSLEAPALSGSGGP